MERLEFRADLPDPVLTAATDVRVRVHAAALNHLDLFVVRGMPGVTITAPWVLGATLSEDGQDTEGGDGGGARPNDRSSRDKR